MDDKSAFLLMKPVHCMPEGHRQVVRVFDTSNNHLEKVAVAYTIIVKVSALQKGLIIK